MKSKLFLMVVLSFLIVGCAGKTPLPKCQGEFHPINSVNN